MVAGVGEVDVVVGVEHDAGRLFELAALAAVPAPAIEQRARFVIDVHLLRVLLGDVHAVVGVDCDAAWPAQLPVAARARRAELAVEVLVDVDDGNARRGFGASGDIYQPLRVERRIYGTLETAPAEYAVTSYGFDIVVSDSDIDLLLGFFCRGHVLPASSQYQRCQGDESAYLQREQSDEHPPHGAVHLIKPMLKVVESPIPDF